MFTEARKDYIMQQNQGQHRFHAANVTEATDTATTVEALANLASATVPDRSAIANLTATNERLTAHIEKLSKQLSTAMQKSHLLSRQRINKFVYQQRIRPNQMRIDLANHANKSTTAGCTVSKLDQMALTQA